MRIELDGPEYVVRTPYTDAGLAAMRSLPYTARRFDWDAKVWRVSVHAKRFLFAALKRAFPGATACGPKGLFTL